MTSITCPNCGKSGSLESQLPPGAKVRCKGCNRSFEPTIKMQLTECRELDNGPFEELTPPLPPTAPRQVQPASVPPTQSSIPADLINAKLNSATEPRGVAIVEYALFLALISLVCLAGMSIIADKINGVMSSISTTI